MDPAQRLQVETERVTDFVEPLLERDEEVTTVLASGWGPLSPLILLIPFVNFLGMTRLLRAYAIVLTNRRFLLVRVKKSGRLRTPQRLDTSAPLGQVGVVSWTARTSGGLVKFDVDGQRLRLHITDIFHLQMPALLEKLGYTPVPDS